MLLHPAVSDISSRRDQLAEAVRKGHLTPELSRYAQPGWAYILKDRGLPALAYPRVGNYDSADEGEGAITYVITTDEEDRDGDVVRPIGAHLGNYRLNPLVFFGHQEKPVPIGVCRSPDGELTVRPEERWALATIHFDLPDPDAAFIHDKCKRKILNATSIAFVPIEAWRRDDVRKARTHSDQSAPGWYFNQWDMTELSVVGVPSNPKAVGLEKDLMGACRDVFDRERGFMSPQLRKAWRPYAAQAKGCWGGWCPLPGEEKDIGGGVVLKAVVGGRDVPTGPDPSKPNYYATFVGGKWMVKSRDLSGNFGPYTNKEEAEKAAADLNSRAKKSPEKSAEPDPEMDLAAEVRKVGEELAVSTDPAPMPGYGQIFRGPDSQLWYVGGDGDEDGFSDLVQEKLGQFGEVTYAAEVFPPEDEGWEQLYPEQKMHTSKVACDCDDCAEGKACGCRKVYGDEALNALLTDEQLRQWVRDAGGDPVSMTRQQMIDYLMKRKKASGAYFVERRPDGWYAVLHDEGEELGPYKSRVEALREAEKYEQKNSESKVLVHTRIKAASEERERLAAARFDDLQLRRIVREEPTVEEALRRAEREVRTGSWSDTRMSGGKLYSEVLVPLIRQVYSEKSMRKAKDVLCPRCKGEGTIKVSGAEQPCPRCNGAGVIFAAGLRKGSGRTWPWSGKDEATKRRRMVELEELTGTDDADPDDFAELTDLKEQLKLKRKHAKAKARETYKLPAGADFDAIAWDAADDGVTMQKLSDTATTGRVMLTGERADIDGVVHKLRLTKSLHRKQALGESNGSVGGYTVPSGTQSEGWAVCEGCHGDGNCEACGGAGEGCDECGGSGECGACAGEGHVTKPVKSKQKQLDQEPPKTSTPQVLAALYSHAKAEAAYLDGLDEETKGGLADYRRQQLDERMASLKAMFRSTERSDDDLEKLCKEFEDEHDKDDSVVEPGEAGLVEQGQVPPEVEEDDLDDAELEDAITTKRRKTMKQNQIPAPGGYTEDDPEAAAELDSGATPFNKVAPGTDEWAEDESEHKAAKDIPCICGGMIPPGGACPDCGMTEEETKSKQEEVVEEKAPGGVCMCGMDVPPDATECPGCGAPVEKAELPMDEELAELPAPEEEIPAEEEGIPLDKDTNPATEEILERYQHPKSHKWATRKHRVSKSLLPFLKFRKTVDGRKYLVRAKGMDEAVTEAYRKLQELKPLTQARAGMYRSMIQQVASKHGVDADALNDAMFGPTGEKSALDDSEVKALTAKLAGAIDDLKSLVQAKDLPRQYRAGLKHVADQIWYVGKALTDKGKEQKQGGKGSELTDKGKEQRNGGKGSELKDKGEQQGKAVSAAVRKKFEETLAKFQRYGVLNGVV